MDVEELKRKRTNLQLRIKEWFDKGKNAKDLVDEYHILLDELRKNGVKVEAKAKYLQKEFWSNQSTNISKPQIIKEPSPIPEPIKPIQDSFILSLAWVANELNETPEQVKKVESYFNEMGLPMIDESVGSVENRMEHVMRYEFKGTEESFRMLKMCTQFVLDAFAKTDFEKFNIAIYGKKKNY